MTPPLVTTIEQIESYLNRNHIFDAYNLTQKTRQSHPDNLQLMQLLGLCLARLGNTEQARVILDQLYRSGHQDSETSGKLARVYKDLFKQGGQSAHALQSIQIYLKNFEDTGDSYNGINAATMSLILDEPEQAHSIAMRVIEKLQHDDNSYWKYATLGEAKLLIGDYDDALTAYQRAKQYAKSNPGYLSISYEQLKLISRFKEIPSVFLKELKPASVVVFSGHMIDKPDRNTPRFPDAISEAIKADIIRHLDEANAGSGFSSAACGADLLFVEAMLERGGEVNVYLPFALDDFIKTSIAFAGEKWLKRFEAVLSKVNVKYITEESYLGTDELFEYTGEVMMGLALLSAEQSSSDCYFLAVLDRKDATGRPGGAADMLKRWTFKDRIRIIDPSMISHDDHRSPQVDSISSAPIVIEAIPFGVTRALKSILFADFVGYSKLEDAFTPYFVYELLQSVAKKLKGLDAQPEVLNTWGDAIFAVFDKPDHLIKFALTLHKAVLETEWSKKNLSTQTNIRIALHAGPVFVGHDPITHQPNAYGTHIARAARMEPITLPGCIYASEQFASLLLVQAGDRYRCHYVGKLDLPKNFGTQEMYQIVQNG